MLLVVVCCLVSIVTGCTSVNQASPVAPVAVNMELKRSDYTILKTVTGTSYTKLYLGGLVKSVNGNSVIFGIKSFDEKYSRVPGQISGFDLIQLLTFGIVSPGPSTAERAYYNALAQTPDADFVLSKACNESNTGFCLFYSKETVEFVGKAIKLKSDADLAK